MALINDSLRPQSPYKGPPLPIGAGQYLPLHGYWPWYRPSVEAVVIINPPDAAPPVVEPIAPPIVNPNYGGGTEPMIFLKVASVAVTKYPLEGQPSEQDKYTNIFPFGIEWGFGNVYPTTIRAVFRCPSLNWEFSHTWENIQAPAPWSWQVRGWLPDVKPGLYTGYMKLQALGDIEMVDALWEGGTTRIPKGPAPILDETSEYEFTFQVKEDPGTVKTQPRAAEPSVLLLSAKLVSPTQVEFEYQVNEPPDWMKITAIGRFDSYVYARVKNLAELGKGLHKKTLALQKSTEPGKIYLEASYGYSDLPSETMTRRTV